MGTKVKVRSAFGDLLRRDLDESDVSLKELARRLSRPDATVEQVNGKRRLLQKYLIGDVSPGADMRQEIARALEKDLGRYDEEAEEAEELRQIADALAPLALALHRLAVQARERNGAL